MKKAFDIIWGSIIIIMAILFLLVLALLFVPQTVNDMALSKFEKEVMESFSVPENAEMIEYVSGCGNTSGAGDHTELCVAVLIKSSLDSEELREYYADKSYTYVHDCSGFTTIPIGMRAINLEFETDIGEGAGYYIVQCSKSAPLSWLDIRGM